MSKRLIKVCSLVLILLIAFPKTTAQAATLTPTSGLTTGFLSTDCSGLRRINEAKLLTYPEISIKLNISDLMGLYPALSIKPLLCSYDQMNFVNYDLQYNTETDISKIKLNYFDDFLEKYAVKCLIQQNAHYLQGDTDYDTIKNVHDYICNTADYDYNVYKIIKAGQNTTESCGAYDVLFNHKAICTGYSLAFQAFMEYFSIPSYCAIGIVNGEGHAWNIVQINGEWYHIDCTFDGEREDISYKYFLLGANDAGYTKYGEGENIIELAEMNYNCI